jgi:hypothetical protein
MINLIGADTGLWLRPVQYEQRAGLKHPKNYFLSFQEKTSFRTKKPSKLIERLFINGSNTGGHIVFR